ncbi:MAG: DUF1501 domain-containing protein [Planctomyces sp.]|nr:DUF1501 domain-containing protein [Planctomyces sp.]
MHPGIVRQTMTADVASLFCPSLNPAIRIGSRRWMLQVGSLGAATLAGLVPSRASETRADSTRPTAVIQIWLSGGPSQIDMWDPKPEMPPEIRGPFGTIATSIPGVQFCEHLPRQAAMLDKLTVVRSMDASSSNHTPITFQAANPKAQRTEVGRQGGGYPSMGSIAAKFRGPCQPGMPPYVALANSLAADIYGAGDLGQEFEPLDGGRVNGRFAMPKGVEVPRLQNRDQLRRELDLFRSRTELSTGFQQQERYAQEAYQLVMGGAAEKAFDLSQESDAIRDRYGRDSMGEKALLARRLVEAGVTYVTLSDAWGHWDHHGDEVQWGGIEKGLKPMLPVLDRGFTTLIEDLEERGLLETTLVVLIGEFGRSPVMTKTAGRDHWPSVMSFVLAGGGFSQGRIIGATDRRGGSIHEHPLGPGDLAATVFHHLGIAPNSHWISPSGRPTPLVESGSPLQNTWQVLPL